METPSRPQSFSECCGENRILHLQGIEFQFLNHSAHSLVTLLTDCSKLITPAIPKKRKLFLIIYLLNSADVQSHLQISHSQWPLTGQTTTYPSLLKNEKYFLLWFWLYAYVSCMLSSCWQVLCNVNDTYEFVMSQHFLWIAACHRVNVTNTVTAEPGGSTPLIQPATGHVAVVFSSAFYLHNMTSYNPSKCYPLVSFLSILSGLLDTFHQYSVFIYCLPHPRYIV